MVGIRYFCNEFLEFRSRRRRQPPSWRESGAPPNKGISVPPRTSRIGLATHTMIGVAAFRTPPSWRSYCVLNGVVQTTRCRSIGHLDHGFFMVLPHQRGETSHPLHLRCPKSYS